jgi:hypothetical protein
VGLVEVGNLLGKRVVGNVEGDLEIVEGMKVLEEIGGLVFIDDGLVVRDCDGNIEIVVGFLVFGKMLGVEDGLTLGE